MHIRFHVSLFSLFRLRFCHFGERKKKSSKDRQDGELSSRHRIALFYLTEHFQLWPDDIVKIVFAKIPLFMQMCDWPWLSLSDRQDNAHFSSYYVMARVDLRQPVCNTGVLHTGCSSCWNSLCSLSLSSVKPNNASANSSLRKHTHNKTLYSNFTHDANSSKSGWMVISYHIVGYCSFSCFRSASVLYVRACGFGKRVDLGKFSVWLMRAVRHSGGSPCVSSSPYSPPIPTPPCLS